MELYFSFGMMCWETFQETETEENGLRSTFQIQMKGNGRRLWLKQQIDHYRIDFIVLAVIRKWKSNCGKQIYSIEQHIWTTLMKQWLLNISNCQSILDYILTNITLDSIPYFNYTIFYQLF